MSEILPVNIPSIDIFLGLLLLLGILMGLSKGFTATVLGLINWLVAILVAIKYVHVFSAFVLDWIISEALSNLIGYILIFIISVWIGKRIINIILGFINALRLTTIDRLLGGVFGFLRVAVLLIVLLSFTRPVFEETSWWRDSNIILSLGGYEDTVFDAFESLFGLYEDEGEVKKNRRQGRRGSRST